jgi:uncharacterized protein YdeI (YjbR/CyaY-like superfamily)
MPDQTTRAGLPIAHFVNQKAFEAWLAKQPAACPGLWLRLKKKGSDLASTLTKQEAIESALCHGWIDGQLDTHDEGSFLIRFTPRRPKSKWSAVNAKRAAELVDNGRMCASGQAEIDAARSDGRWKSAYASQGSATVPDDLRKALDANPKAAAFFATLTGVNRYAILYRINAVKRAETRTRKIAEYVAMCQRGEVLHPKK